MAQTYNNAEVRIRYIVQGIEHRMNLGIQFSAPYTIGENPSLATKGGTPSSADGLINDLVTLVAAGYNNTVDFSDYEIWDIDQYSTEPTFVYGAALGISGGSALGIGQAWQVTMLYRAETGKVGKLILLEPIYTNYGQYARPFLTVLENIAVSLESALSFVYHSSGGFVTTVYKYNGTTNNALERKRYRVG